MPETTPLIKAALNLRGGAGFDVYYGNNNINDSLDCFQHALSIFDESVTDQQKFLFRTNKIVLLLKKDQDICSDLVILDEWLDDSYHIIKDKLSKTYNIQKENKSEK